MDSQTTITGTEGNDKLVSANDGSLLEGLGGDDSLYGLAGSDTLLGGLGKDFLFGRDGNDELNGGEGDDRLNGGDGDDYLIGGAGKDILFGGAGNDVFEFSLGLGATRQEMDSIDFLSGEDKIAVRQADGQLLAANTSNFVTVDGSEVTSVESATALANTSFSDTVRFVFVYNLKSNGRGYLIVSGEGSNTADLIVEVLGTPSKLGLLYSDILSDEAPRATQPGATPNLVATISGSTEGAVIEDDEQNSVQGNLTVDDPDGVNEFDATRSSPNLRGEFGDFTFDAVTGDWAYILDNTRDATQALAEGQVTYDYLVVYSADGSASQRITVQITGKEEPVVLATTTDDLIVGTDRDDALNGLEGADTLEGRLGNDTLDGGTGHDSLLGEDGNDVLFGGADDDYLDGGKGDDLLDGGDGNDELRGYVGNDTLLGGAGDDLLLAGAGRTLLKGEAGNDKIRGHNGDDQIFGGEGQDDINGGKGNDTIDGGLGNDKIDGGDGDDLIDGADGNDVIVGGNGQDTIAGGGGNDRLTGGADADRFVFSSNDPDLALANKSVILDFESGVDKIAITNQAGDLVAANGENFVSIDANTVGSFSEAVAHAETLLSDTTQFVFVYGIGGRDGVLLVSTEGGSRPNVVVELFGAATVDSVAATDIFSNAAAVIVNTPATIDGDLSGGVTEDDQTRGTATGTLTVTDPDSGENTFQPVATQGLNGVYGSFTFDEATGDWSYTLDNSRAVTQALNTGNSKQETLTVVSFDGTATAEISVLVIGQDEPNNNPVEPQPEPENTVATITGISTGEVTEDVTPGLVSGTLTVNDPDANENVFQAVVPTALNGAYGQFTFNETTGEWSYKLDNTLGATQALNGGETKTERLTVVSADGSAARTISVTVKGQDEVNSPAVISGSSTGEVTDLIDPVATGTLTVSDNDPGQGRFKLDGVSTQGTFGSYTLNTNSQGDVLDWTYTADSQNGNTRALGAGDNSTEVLRIYSLDESAFVDLTVRVFGLNDVALIAGDTTGSVHEASDIFTAGGKLTVSDVDINESRFSSIFEQTNTYGRFTFDSLSGEWTYALDNALEATLALKAGEFKTETLKVTSVDGSTTQDVVVTVYGRETKATIGGSFSGSVKEDTDPNVASGSLTITDPDSDEVFLPVADGALEGIYGTFTFDSLNGQWSYALDNTRAATQALTESGKASDSGIDTLKVTSSDQTATQTIQVVVQGTNDEATITGTFSGSVVEDSTANTFSGSLRVQDLDAGESILSNTFTTSNPSDKAQNGNNLVAITAYGTFRVSLDGDWVYELNNNSEATQALGSNQFVEDILIVTSLDGTASRSINVTINGQDEIAQATEGPDYIVGTPNKDVIDALGGNDTVLGRQENDVLIGGSGDDRLFGEDGDDLLDGGSGNDELQGQLGNDTLNGGEGEDLLFGQEGDDELNGGIGNDTLVGQQGSDTLNGGEGDDSLYGVEDDDLLDGGSGNDQLFGGTGNDTLRGDAGNDRLFGEDGNDLLDGGTGNDELQGQFGNDTLNGGEGEDLLFGQEGDDELNGGIGNDTLVGQQGNDILNGGDGDDSLYGVDDDDLLDGGSGNDQLFGGTGNDTLRGVAGNDRLFGEDGDDTLFGEEDDDLLNGGRGNDALVGGAGNDTLIGDAGNDELNGGAGQDYLGGGAGNDILNGDEGDDFLVGEEGDDLIDGGSGNDELQGQLGNDTLNGGEGDDRLSGQEGDDELSGGEGNDVIHADEGNDTLNGGGGKDSLLGYSGDDYINGGVGDDYLDGGDGADSIFGDTGSDALLGGIGNDLLSGGAGNDTVYGNEGDDFLNGDGGDDQIFGGEGDDSLLGGNGNDVISGEGGFDVLEGQLGNDSLYGGSGNDILIGGEGNDYLVNGVGGNFLYGGEADDQLFSFDIGGDQLYGEQGDDYLVATGTGQSTLHGGDGNDTLFGSGGSHLLFGGVGNDTLGGSDGVSLYGDDGDDFLSSSGANVAAYGGLGNDTITGSAFQAFGGEGDDVIRMDYSNNLITEEALNLNSKVIGGSGNDRFETYIDASNFSFIGGTEEEPEATGKDELWILYFSRFHSGSGEFELKLEDQQLQGVEKILVASAFGDLQLTLDLTSQTEGFEISLGEVLIHDGSNTSSLLAGSGNDVIYNYVDSSPVFINPDVYNSFEVFSGDGDDVIWYGEKINAGRGDDIVFFTGNSFQYGLDISLPTEVQITGGDGSDSFNYIVKGNLNVASITDFSVDDTISFIDNQSFELGAALGISPVDFNVANTRTLSGNERDKSFVLQISNQGILTDILRVSNPSSFRDATYESLGIGSAASEFTDTVLEVFDIVRSYTQEGEVLGLAFDGVSYLMVDAGSSGEGVIDLGNISLAGIYESSENVYSIVG